MADFLSALKVGLVAADSAEKNKEEIREVFRDLNRQLAEGTNRKVAIERVVWSNPLAAFNAITGKQGEVSKKWYLNAKSLIAKSESHTIAGWKHSRAGYPCTISIGDSDIHCTDRQGLERGLAILLQDPAVGEIIAKLLLLEPDPAQPTKE